MKNMQAYMIKNTKTGKYFRKESYGGGRWSDVGDIWTNKRHVKTTIDYSPFLNGVYAPADPFEVVVVEFKEVTSWTPEEFK